MVGQVGGLRGRGDKLLDEGGRGHTTRAELDIGIISCTTEGGVDVERDGVHGRESSGGEVGKGGMFFRLGGGRFGRSGDDGSVQLKRGVDIR